MKVCTKNYEATHGHKPSGCGSWAFELCKAGQRETVFMPCLLPYATASRVAKDMARRKGCDSVSVAS